MISSIKSLFRFFQPFRELGRSSDNGDNSGLSDLVIYDDIYPHPSSGFRIEEFNALLYYFKNSKILISGLAYQFFQLPEDLHKKHVQQLLVTDNSLKDKVIFYNAKDSTKIRCKLFYCIFLHNIYGKLNWLNSLGIPFVFTLYPGGGFNPGKPETDDILKAVFSSPGFRKVIVTQKKTYDYLFNKNLCRKEDICFIFGVVVPQQSLSENRRVKKYYKTDKDSFDISFCASKYTKFGEDKGYPLFIEFAHAIYMKYPDVRFHIIGGFDKDVINVDSLGDKIQFYGYRDFDKLGIIFQKMDLIISPNEPNKLSEGAFDGFPLGTVIEAAFNEVGVMLTDLFAENQYFDEQSEIIIIKPTLEDLIHKFEIIMNDLRSFYELSGNGKRKFEKIYSAEQQLTPRVSLLENLIFHSSK